MLSYLARLLFIIFLISIPALVLAYIPANADITALFMYTFIAHPCFVYWLVVQYDRYIFPY
jgi:hypothetical protein